MGASTGREFTWDGENRLIRVAPTTPQDGDIKVEFAYDYLGRRIEKIVTEWDIGDPNTPTDDDWASTPISHLRWMYYQWQPLLELNGASSNAPTKKYAWGLDLAGSGDNPKIDGVAGIGGLLAVRDVAQSKSFVYLYDGNGNVGQLVNLADGTTVAEYEYDAYGNVTTSGGAYASTNVMRFSTKPWDDETGLGYWGYRYYDAGNGRWGSRDPLEESGGTNLFRYGDNDGINSVDPTGRVPICIGCASRSPAVGHWKDHPTQLSVRTTSALTLQLYVAGPEPDWGGPGNSRGNCWRYVCNDPLKPGESHFINPGGASFPNGVNCKEAVDGAKARGAKPTEVSPGRLDPARDGRVEGRQS